MKCLFIGSIYSENFKNYLMSQGVPSSSAGQTFETALLEGMGKIMDVNVISEFCVPCFPKFKKFRIFGESYSIGSIPCKSISYINIPLVKQITQMISYFEHIKKTSDSFDIIVIYELTSRQLLPVVLAGRKSKKVVIVPDLPEFMSENRNPLYLFAKKIDRCIIDWALKRMDGLVLLSPYMKERLHVGEKPWIVIEGLFSPKDVIKDSNKLEKKIVLYTGKIEKWFGVEDLLEAFTQIHGDQYQMWLCGPGDIEMVNKYSSKDNRIIYKGCLTHKDVLNLQKQVSLLVNPRHSYDKFTLYSFPSKTMEYMASGTPTLMSRLKSLPKDYLDHLYLFEDESIEGMSKMIKHCLDKPDAELNDFGAAAAEFILSNKTSDIQAQKLLSFLSQMK